MRILKDTEMKFPSKSKWCCVCVRIEKETSYAALETKQNNFPSFLMEGRSKISKTFQPFYRFKQP